MYTNKQLYLHARELQNIDMSFNLFLFQINWRWDDHLWICGRIEIQAVFTNIQVKQSNIDITIINIQLSKLQKYIRIPFLCTLPIVHNLLIFVYIILAVLFTLLRLPICNVFKGIKLYAYIVGSYSSVS